jgi:hypothetical protein
MPIPHLAQGSAIGSLVIPERGTPGTAPLREVEGLKHETKSDLSAFMICMFFLALCSSNAKAEIVCVGSTPQDINRITPALHEHPSPHIERREVTVKMKYAVLATWHIRSKIGEFNSRSVNRFAEDKSSWSPQLYSS